MIKQSCTACTYGEAGYKCRHRKKRNNKGCSDFYQRDFGDEKKNLTKVLQRITGTKNVSAKLKLFYKIFEEEIK